MPRLVSHELPATHHNSALLTPMHGLWSCNVRACLQQGQLMLVFLPTSSDVKDHDKVPKVVYIGDTGFSPMHPDTGLLQQADIGT